MLRHIATALFAAIVLSPLAMAQIVQPMGLTHPNAKPLATLPVYAVPALNRVAIEAEDRNRSLQGLPPRYAIPNPVVIDQATHGSWEVLDPAWSLWRARIQAPDASHVNLGFSRFAMPPTARLMIYSSDYQNVLRPFDSDDHQPTGELWTPVVDGEEMVIELYVQTVHRPQLELTLAQVGSGYRFFGAGSSAVRDNSGACNIDVHCPIAAPWASEIPCVAALSSAGTIFCTGFMVNNTAENGTPYFMTAYHCGVTAGNASSLVCYWNHQRAVCGNGIGPLNTFTSGATLRAEYSNTDFTLLELSSTPNPAWGVTYAGWDRSGADASSAVAIHHPSGDVKKISFENQATTTTSYLGTSVPGSGTHIRVDDWDVGTTEPGSSGSPLFDQDHRVIGQLEGGYAACGNSLSDWYGRFSGSWTGGGTNSSSLANWLDPLGTGQMTVNTLGVGNAATLGAYGVGCYTSSASFFEEFANGCDLSGTPTATVGIAMTPITNGFDVVQGANAWFQPTSPNLNLGDDSVSPLITLPFSFQFPGGSTNQVRMCSNGFVWLSDQNNGDYSPTVTELCAEPPRLAPLWMDLSPNLAGATHYDVDPAGQAVYFTWLAVPRWGVASSTNTFQVVLRSNGTAEYRYRSVDGPVGGSCIVGWSRGNGVLEPPMVDLTSGLPLSISIDQVGLTLSTGDRPIMGTTMQLNVEEIPITTIMAAMLLGWHDHPTGIPLAAIGMPDCYQYTSMEFVWTQFVVGPVSTFAFTVPNGTWWDGRHMYAQAASLTLGYNQLGGLSSNALDLGFATW